jgi:glycerate kinase
MILPPSSVSVATTRVLVAFDKFKDALPAQTAGEIVAKELQTLHPDWAIDTLALTDGGEGFAEILTQVVGGERVSCDVTGPRGTQVRAHYGLVPAGSVPAAAWAQFELSDALPFHAKIAVIELASASGLALLGLDQRDPWQATTFGTGELIKHAAERGAAAIVLGVGGSATHDLGLGALAALGFEFQTESGNRVDPPVPARWQEITQISGRLRASFPPIFIACDVTNPLLGLRGAAAVYGAQKGLEPKDHGPLERESERLARLLCAHVAKPTALMNEPGTGAAGGISFGLMVAAGAKLLPGFDFVSAWLGLSDEKMRAADIVITGEGRFDASSLDGKGPGAIAARGIALGKNVHVFAGQVNAPAQPGLELHAITPADTPLSQALREAPQNLAATVRRVFGQKRSG